MYLTRLSSLCSLLPVFAFLATLVVAQCPKKLRKEVRDLSAVELAALHKAFWKLNRNGSMAKFTRLHVEHKDKGHFNPSFAYVCMHAGMLAKRWLAAEKHPCNGPRQFYIDIYLSAERYVVVPW